MQRGLTWIAFLGLATFPTDTFAQPTAAASADAAPAARAEAEASAGRNLKAQNTWFGSTGGLHVIDGSSAEPGTLRLQLGFDYFRVGGKGD